MKLKIPHLPFWAWAMAGVFSVLAVNAAVTLPTYTTTKKEFCITCHHQQREASFWEQSTIHPKINCSECHATGNALMPSINILPLKTGGEHAGFSAKLDQINPNCVRCHTRVLDVESASPKVNPYNVWIPHRFHIQELKNACTACHYNVYHDPHDPPTFRPPKEACFECHRREKTSCSICHPKGAIPLPVTTDVSHTECVKCHKGFETAKVEIYGLSFPHQKHLPKVLNCTVCHATGPEHGKIHKTRLECLSCHHQSNSSCHNCHQAQLAFIRGEGPAEKDTHPDTMAQAVKCAECHDKISKGHSFLDVKNTCVGCHDARYRTMPDVWQKEISGRMLRVKQLLDRMRSGKDEGGMEKKKADRLIEEVERLLKPLDHDKSKGAHNFEYARTLLSEAEEKVFSTKKPLTKRTHP